jgi:hypothetical protein
MKNKDFNAQFEAIKRQVADVVRDMHARKLAVPAAALLFAIVAAMVLLPKGGGSAPPAPATTAQLPKPHVEPVAQISIVKPSSLDKSVALTGSSDPFGGTSGYNCKQISSDPKVLECEVSNLLVKVYCDQGTSSPACAETGASGATGGSGGGSTDGTGGSGGSGGSTGGKTVWYQWEASVKVDLKTYKKVHVNDELPSNAPLVVLAGGDNTDHTAVFIAAQGVTVSGVPVDPSFNAFKLGKGESATLTDSSGDKHTIKLNSIKLVASSTKP